MRRALPLALAALLAGTAPAFAHTLKVFAAAEGAVVSGYAYFAGGGRAREVRVVVATRAGETLHETATDDQGAFRFEARRRTDHVVTVDAGDGHRASQTVPAHELPETLPADVAAAMPAATAPQTAEAAPTAALPALSRAELAALIEQSVARQVRPLREQLDAAQAEARWHDALGGIGIIIGFAGLAYGLSMRPRARTARPPAREITAP